MNRISDELALLLDDLAAVANHWEKRRNDRITPFSIGEALLLVIGDINQLREYATKAKLVTAPAKIRSTHITSFRYDEWATITAVKMTTPEGLQPRPGFECTYDDGVIDYIPLEELALYEIKGE